MSAAQQVLVALGSSFAVMAVGLAISRAEVLTEPARKGLAKLYASLVFPMMVFKGVAAIDMGAIDKHALGREVQAAFTRKLWRDVAASDPTLRHLAGGAAVGGLRRRLAKAQGSPAWTARWSSARNAIVGCIWPVQRRADASPPLASSSSTPTATRPSPHPRPPRRR